MQNAPTGAPRKPGKAGEPGTPVRRLRQQELPPGVHPVASPGDDGASSPASGHLLLLQRIQRPGALQRNAKSWELEVRLIAFGPRSGQRSGLEKRRRKYFSCK